MDRREFLVALPTFLLALESCVRPSSGKRIYIDQNLCLGCGNCLDCCSFSAIQLPQRGLFWIEEDECYDVNPTGAVKAQIYRASIDQQRCTLYTVCISRCEYRAIKIGG